MAFWNNKKPDELRVISTARDEQSINHAAEQGFFPLLKKVEPLDEIKAKFSVIQHRRTGVIEVIHDLRIQFHPEKYKGYDLVIDWSFYYPYKFNSPFAAYLIPKDIKKGERVFVEDVIQDIVGSRWSQGDTFRLNSCEAIRHSALPILAIPHAKPSWLAEQLFKQISRQCYAVRSLS